MRGGAADVALVDGSPQVLRRRNRLQAHTAFQPFAAGAGLLPPDVGGGGDLVLQLLVLLRPGPDGFHQAQADVLVQLVDGVVDCHAADQREDDRGDYGGPVLCHVF